MKVAIIGTGYVGLVTGTCLAETGNDVTCVDCDARKIERLLRGDVPIYEPGLSELIARNAAAGLLHFTTDLAATRDAAAIFLAVGTPPADDGSVDLSALWAAVSDLAPHLPERRHCRLEEHRARGHQRRGDGPAAQSSPGGNAAWRTTPSSSKKGRPSTTS